jgi:hypothetical protein
MPSPIGSPDALLPVPQRHKGNQLSFLLGPLCIHFSLLFKILLAALRLMLHALAFSSIVSFKFDNHCGILMYSQVSRPGGRKIKVAFE